jgi:hypothetical protein
VLESLSNIAEQRALNGLQHKGRVNGFVLDVRCSACCAWAGRISPKPAKRLSLNYIISMRIVPLILSMVLNE